MASIDSRTGTYMLPLAKLTMHQLTNKAFETGFADVGERLQGVLRLDQRRALSEKQGQKKAAPSTVGPRSRRKKQRSVAPVPTRCDIKTGWGTLLTEVTSSDKRVRVAKGGHFGQNTERPLSGTTTIPSALTDNEEVTAVESVATKKDATLILQSATKKEVEDPPPACDDTRERLMIGSESEHVEEETAVSEATQATGTPRDSMGSPRSGQDMVCSDVAEISTWQSYRIDDKKVPDKVLTSMWRRAVDPKHCIDEVEPLAKVPRMTVTKREVEQLPPVHDIQYWRAVKTKKREARKAHEESEEYPPLSEMMRIIFGREAPPRARAHGFYAQMKEKEKHLVKRLSNAAGWTVSVTADEESTEGEREIMEKATLEAAADMDREEEVSRVADDTQLFIGVMKKGRRGALDEGRPWDRVNIPLARPLVQKEENKIGDNQRLPTSHLSRTYESSHKAQFDTASTQRLAAATAKVNENCQRKVARMHSQFQRKQGQLSARLTRRVQRLQMDFQETQDNKVGSILPSVVAWDGAKSSRGSSPVHGNLKKGSSDRGDTVLQYLQHHRHKAEQERQTHHAAYLQQVERFEGYLRLLADPNRNPDRGELYLSECFRHVLAAGLIVDNSYFIRCLRNLESEDFEKTATVNLLAACCEAFDIDLKRYWEHLRKRGLSCFTPRPQKHEARSWEDWAPWDGVRLDEDMQHCVDDPFPFVPIVPENTPSASELVSRNDGDPLRQILSSIKLDSVLERYQLHRRPEGPPQQQVRREVEDTYEEDVAINLLVTPTGSTSSTQDASYWVGQPRTPRTPPKALLTVKSSTPPGHTPRGAQGRPGVRKGMNGGLSTLQRTRGVAEPMADMVGAPDKDRHRLATQPPSMAPITEQPFLE